MFWDEVSQTKDRREEITSCQMARMGGFTGNKYFVYSCDKRRSSGTTQSLNTVSTAAYWWSSGGPVCLAVPIQYSKKDWPSQKRATSDWKPRVLDTFSPAGRLFSTPSTDLYRPIQSTAPSRPTAQHFTYFQEYIHFKSI